MGLAIYQASRRAHEDDKVLEKNRAFARALDYLDLSTRLAQDLQDKNEAGLAELIPFINKYIKDNTQPESKERYNIIGIHLENGREVVINEKPAKEYGDELVPRIIGKLTRRQPPRDVLIPESSLLGLVQSIVDISCIAVDRFGEVDGGDYSLSRERIQDNVAILKASGINVEMLEEGGDLRKDYGILTIPVEGTNNGPEKE